MEIFRAFGTLIEPPTPEHEAIARLIGLDGPPPRTAYSDLFLFQLYPYASAYLGPEGMLGGEARDRIAGFWRALGESPPPEPDHLAVMLALYARLAELEADAVDERLRNAWRHARRACLWEHLVSWLPVYLDKLSGLADPFYRGWAKLLDAALAAEASDLGPQHELSLHLREAPDLEDPRHVGGERFLEGLLTPVRSGMILVRSDLERAAADLGLGARVGERRFVLRALFAQDPSATLAWLGAEAEASAGKCAAGRTTWGSVSSFWESRARRTGELLEGLSESVKARG